ncbi:hypothetical protein [Streptomyces sp. MJP52]|nr:hypothetical protein [Streptomyces sp. MJP52]MDH6224304.1 hypothetical protein [Streptomyces sp. MJP52]
MAPARPAASPPSTKPRVIKALARQRAEQAARKTTPVVRPLREAAAAGLL